MRFTMDRYKAGSVKNGNFLELSFGPFTGCKNLVQQIKWILSEWEESVVESSAKVGHAQVQKAERMLYKTKRKLWRLWTTAYQNMEARKDDDQQFYFESTRAPEGRGKVMSTNNGELPNISPLKNLIMEWSVLLDGKGRLCLQGVMPDVGEWATTPIARRLNQTTVKTFSGTIYNILGPMAFPSGVNIPDFVKKAFKMGIPKEWEKIVKNWNAFIKHEKFCNIENNKNNYKNQVRRMSNSVNTGTSTEKRQTAVIDDQAPNSPAINCKNWRMSQTEIFSSTGLPSKRKYVSTEKTSQLLATQYAFPNKAADSIKDPQNKAELFRYSRRLLKKSVLKNSVNEGDGDKNATNSQDIKFLKLWSIEYSNEYYGLILKGRLISKQNKVIDQQHRSSRVCSRLKPYLVETEEGFYYRLVGSSSLISSDGSIPEFVVQKFINGFPMDWELVVKEWALFRKEGCNQARVGDQDQILRLNPRVFLEDIKKNRSLQINMSNKIMMNSTTNNHFAELDSQAVRKNTTLKIQPFKHMETKKPDVSEGKKGSINNSQNLSTKAAESRIVASEMNDEQTDRGTLKKIHENDESNNKKKEQSLKKNYPLGLLTDNCDSESDFNIF